MRRKIGIILSIVFAVSLVFATGITTALAAGDANGVVFEVTLENRNYGNGDAVKPVVTIANTGANPIVVTGLTCNNNSIMPDGGITVGAGSQTQTQPSLKASFATGSNTQALNFALAYTVNGVAGPAALTTGIQINQASTIKIDASDSVDKKTADAGDKVKFTFKFTNSGNVVITNASLKAPPLNNGSVIGTPFTLNPGDSKTMEWSENVNKTIAVKPVLSYTANSTNKTQSLSTLNVTVKQVVNSGMTVELKADKETINPGDQVSITATVTNTGNDTLKNIKLLDGNSNPVTLQETTLEAGASTTATIPESPQATANYQFTATATNTASSAVNATSNQLTVTVGSASASPSGSGTEPATSEVAALKVFVEADSYTLDKPGNVKLQVTIQNTSDVLLNNVQVTEKTLGDIGTISALSKDSKTFNKSAQVDKTTQYIFTVTATQPDGKTITAVTDPLSITVSGGGALFGGDMMTTILIIVIIAIAVVGLILFLLYRRNRSGGGGNYGGGGSGKGAYTANRKPASNYNNSPRNSPRDVEPPKVVRKPVNTATPRPSARKDTKFGDRNKF